MQVQNLPYPRLTASGCSSRIPGIFHFASAPQKRQVLKLKKPGIRGSNATPMSRGSGAAKYIASRRRMVSSSTLLIAALI